MSDDVRQLAGRQNSKAPRHAEVNQESAVALEPENQVLAATIDRRDALTLDLGRHDIRRERPNEPRIEDRCVLDPCTSENRRDLPAHRLDLGKLGHGSQRSRVAESVR